MRNRKPTVLVIETDKAVRDMLRRDLSQDFHVLMPGRPSTLLSYTDRVDAIVVCCKWFGDYNVVELARRMAWSFKGPIIAVTKHHDEMEAAGCNMFCTNFELSATLRLALGMPLTSGSILTAALVPA